MARSYLFIPGDVPRMLQNMDVFEADAVIVDFEDAIATHTKDEARDLTRAFITKHHENLPDIYVRVNAVEHDDFMRDIDALFGLDITGIVLPKADTHALKRYRETFEKKGEHPLHLIALIETPRACLDMLAIADYPLVRALMLGGEDLTSALATARTNARTEIATARGLMVLAAAAAGIDSIDTPYPVVDHPEGLQADIAQSVAFGFSAKACIHPNHVDAVNRAFTPSQAAVDEARRILAMHEKTGSTRFSLDGNMIDKPIIERAKNVIKQAGIHGRDLP